MGNAEIALALSVVGPLAIGVIAYFIKAQLSDVKEQSKKLSEHGERLVKLEASTVTARVEEHGTRLTAIELGLAEIKGDLRYVKRWVEEQSRRQNDRKD